MANTTRPAMKKNFTNVEFQAQIIDIVNNPRPIKRRMDSVFHKTEMKIWAGQNLLPKGQHLLS